MKEIKPETFKVTITGKGLKVQKTLDAEWVIPILDVLVYRARSMSSDAKSKIRG